MGRELSERERDVLVAMITYANDPSAPAPITPDRRSRWLRQANSVRAGAACGCGTCPSIEVEDGSPAPDRGPRIVLSAGSPGALLLLFVDDDRLSYLELAPTDPDVSILQFPTVEQISF